MAICIEDRDSPSSDPVHPLIPQSPSPTSLTSKLVRPNLRYFMIKSSNPEGAPPLSRFMRQGGGFDFGFASLLADHDSQIRMHFFNTCHQNYCACSEHSGVFNKPRS